jgi:CspA family cold shock protein
MNRKRKNIQGIVKWYSVKQGYGFIQGKDGKDIFFHKSEIPFWSIFLNKGDKVEYQEKNSKKGLIAMNLKLLQ